MMLGRFFLLLLPLAWLLLAAMPGLAQPLDAMRDSSRWSVSASDQVRATLKRAGDGSLCLDYDFAGVSGHAAMRRELPMDWPDDFVLQARLRGSSHGQQNDFQLKLVDASGDRVWWVNRPAMPLPAKLAELNFKRRHISFAWGPGEDKQLRRSQHIELVVVAGQRGGGGRGQLCLAHLALQPRAPAPAQWPAPRQQASPGQLLIDLGLAREFNGLWLQWPQAVRLGYRVEASADGRRWTRLREVKASDGGADALYLPEQEWRWLRLRYARGQAAPQLALREAKQWPDRNAVLAELARTLPRGEMPRAFLGEQNYWTVVGVDGGAERSGLISEDGAIELWRGGPSVEPMLRLADGRLLGWAQMAEITHSLREQSLPLPAVHWRHAQAELRIEAAADGPADAPQLLARYTLRNPTPQPQRLALLLVLRPWQVNPPQQFLSTQGGFSPVQGLRWQGGGLQIKAQASAAAPWRIWPSAAPAQVSALGFDAGLGVEGLLRAPPLAGLSDASQVAASALLRFELQLGPYEERQIAWQGGTSPPSAQGVALAQIEQRMAQQAARWRERLQRVQIQLPPQGQQIEQSMRSALAQMLVSRQGPALRPGTRSYARSWVRDGAMMLAGLLRMGEQQAAREFVDWYAGYIFASGKVPCCVDQRGADPVPENDSHGQYLYMVAELWRHSQDRALLERHWPRVQQVMAWMEALRQSERGAANRQAGRQHLFGLMPPSISHEGYSDKAAYSYWDDFWALRGYKDAVQIASRLNQPEVAQRWAGWRDEFGRELAASIAATAAHYQIDHIAGAADRGDFDATSTTMALNPAQADLPPPLLANTFERYWQEAQDRAAGRKPWERYTPYELRNVGAMLRLGQTERAHALLDFFFQHQRPAAWRQWAEVVARDPREPVFVGDMPHAWVSSDYLRAALDLLAFEREHAQQAQLVLAAGMLPAWRASGDLSVAGLSTAYGRLDYRLLRRGGKDGGWRLELHHVPERLPAVVGALRLAWPGADTPLPRALHQGQPLAWQGRELPLPPGLITVNLEPQP